MSLPPQESQHRPNSVSSPIILPDELIAEVLSFLPVKYLMRLKCCCKSWNTLMSKPFFIKLHLQRSTQNPHVTLNNIQRTNGTSVVPISFTRLIESSLCASKSITLTDDPYYDLKDKDCPYVVGSCNGLICMHGISYKSREMWFRFWNPATRTISDKLGYCGLTHRFHLTFGYDNSNDTYKVVNLDGGARVFSLGDNIWRNIKSFPVEVHRLTGGVHLSSFVNYIALRNYSNSINDYNVEQFVIISLDLSTETYKELLPPRGFAEVPRIEPSICVLMDCLCFSHVVEVTHFVIWQMKNYGVEESWTQLLKINLQIMDYNLETKFDSQWLPLHLSKNYDTLVLENRLEDTSCL